MEEIKLIGNVTTVPYDPCQNRGDFIAAVEVLLGFLEKDLIRAASSRYKQQRTSTPTCAGRVSPLIGSADLPNASVDQDQHSYGGLLVQTARVMEGLLHLVEEWVTSQVGPDSLSQPTRQCANIGSDGKFTREEGVALSDLVFGAYERTLAHQYQVTVRSGNFAHDIAFLSCMGTAIDATSAALRRQRREITSSRGGMAALHHMSVRPCFFRDQELISLAQEDGGLIQTSDEAVGRRTGEVGDGQCMQEGRVASTKLRDTTNPAATSYSSCLETILRMAVEADTVSWILRLYTRCGVAISASAEPHRRCVGGNSFEDVETEVASLQSPKETDGNLACCTTTREMLADILHSFLYAQSWISGLCTGEIDGLSQMGQAGVGSGGDVMSGTLDSPFGETVRLVLRTWNATEGSSRETVAIDQHAISLLGTSADDGNLLKLAVSGEWQRPEPRNVTDCNGLRVDLCFNSNKRKSAERCDLLELCFLQGLGRARIGASDNWMYS